MKIFNYHMYVHLRYRILQYPYQLNIRQPVRLVVLCTKTLKIIVSWNRRVFQRIYQRSALI